MGVKYGADSSKSGGGKYTNHGTPQPTGSTKSSGLQTGSYGSKDGGGKYTSPGKSKKTMKGPGY